MTKTDHQAGCHQTWVRFVRIRCKADDQNRPPGRVSGRWSEWGSMLGPIAAKLGQKPRTSAQNKAKRTNKIDFVVTLCKQGVRVPPRPPTNIVEVAPA